MKKTLSAVMLFVLGAVAMVVSQQVGQTPPALTALDYAEIQQLYTRYNFATDSKADDGEMWVRTFTEDGVFDGTNPVSAYPYPVEGHEELKAYTTRNLAPGDTSPRFPAHFTTNILIEPRTEGAMGAAHIVWMGEDGVLGRGSYHDELVKTLEGWRFKQRLNTIGAFTDELIQALEQTQ